MNNSTIAALLPDYHTHHELCRHASGKTIHYANSARAAGIKEFAATDHCPTDVAFGQEHRMELSSFQRYVDDVTYARREVPEVNILLGIEADYYTNCETFLLGMVSKYPFDIVLGSVHFRDYWSEDATKRGLSNGDQPSVVWSEYFSLIGRLAETGIYDVVTHLDLPKRFGNPIEEATLREVALPALDRIAKAEMAIEINTSGMIHSIREMYPSVLILSWAAERNIGLVFGSDAHSPDRVGDGFAYALTMARQAGFTQARRYAQRSWTVYDLPGA